MNGRLPHIVLDPGGLDNLSLGQGQFRYVVDLMRGFHTISPAARFTVLGGGPKPVPELAELFSSDPDRWRYIYFPRSRERGAIYRDQARLIATLIRYKANLYHGLHSTLPVFAPCPLVATVYDMMYELFPEYAGAARSRPYRLYRWTVKSRANRIICISRTTAADVSRLWCLPKSRLDVIYLGTTLTSSQIDTPPVPGLPAEVPVIVSPYNLEPRKNLSALVVAFGRLLPFFPAARLVLYGRSAITPEREAEFEKIASVAELDRAIIRTGFLADDQLGWLYRRATIFAFPSLYEGFGYPVLEAMVAGACVVARGASSMAEIMGDTGVTVATASADEFTATLVDLIGDNDRRAALGRAAQSRALQFTVRRMAEVTLSIYERALGRSLLP